MTNEISGRRPRRALSVSLPADSDPVAELDRLVEIFYQVNRTLPKTVLSREELIALGGLLTQISGALLTLTDLLSAPTHHYDRTLLLSEVADATPAQQLQLPTPTGSLRNCRDSYLAAYAYARAFHAGLKRCPRAAPGAAYS
ncbi:MAG: hypothetical protein ACRDS9_23220 [Pseudonocardiaceae bacterium]